ncbi:MAG: chemotaxis-specific protein-glutamate methyltransferase CheB [bacterium]|nr:chemotaxis-specific protein-glutamate methyltransferase CheB [bacterium]
MPIKVLVVDDSTFIRKALIDILRKDRDIQIIGEARDGEEAIEKAISLAPDVITLDYEMPKKSGLDVIQEVLKQKPIPIVMISSYTKEGALITMKCLEAGAVDFISKDIEKGTFEVFRKANEIITKIKSASTARVNSTLIKKVIETYRKPEFKHETMEKPDELKAKKSVLPSEMKKFVVIGASTGGPNTVSEIFSLLPQLPAGFLVVIHMPAVFTGAFSQRLSEKTGFPAKEAKDGDLIEPGKILVAPGGVHTRVEKGGIIRITDQPKDAIYKPSIDIAMETAAEVFGSRTIGVILTGMGNDGSKGVVKIKNKGGKVIVEDEKSAVVFGMPRSAKETGVADYIEDAHRIPAILEKLVLS